MRILFLNNEFPPLGGGTGVINYKLFKEFAKRNDIEIDLITSSRTRFLYEHEQFSERINIFKVPVGNKNIHHSTLWELLLYLLRSIPLTWRLGRSRKYDLTFVFSTLPAGLNALFFKLLNRTPYIVSLQGPDIPGFEIRYKYIYPFLAPAIRLCWVGASVVFANSKKHFELAAQLSPALPQIIIPNGVDLQSFFPREPGLGDTGRPVQILCVARLIKRKGIHILLEACAQLRKEQPLEPFQLVLAGTGDEEQNLREQICTLGLTDIVIFKGVVPQETMPEIYRSADIFVLPSQHEGMSIATLEAMASGLPIVITAVGGSDELLSPGLNGYSVEFGSVDQLVTALRVLIVDRNLRLNMAKKSHEISQSFGWQNIAMLYLDMFTKAIADRALSSPCDTKQRPQTEIREKV